MSFTLLPAELRLRIYELALSEPRIIHIRTLDHPSNVAYLPSPHPSLAQQNLRYSDISWTTHTPPPALLSVSHETRAHALTKYTLRFTLLPAGPEVIYINPSLDIVYPRLERWPEMLRILLRDLRAFDVRDGGRGLRRVAISSRTFKAWFDPGINVVDAERVEIVRGMEEVIVVLGGAVWEDEHEEGGAFVSAEGVPPEDVLVAWGAVIVAGLESEVKMRMVRWRQE